MSFSKSPMMEGDAVSSEEAELRICTGPENPTLTFDVGSILGCF